MKKFNALLITFSLLLISSGEAFSLAFGYATIGSGEVSGLYYVTGGKISEFFGKNKEKHGVGFSVEITRGSVYNINAVLAGKLDFGFAQSDCQYQAYKGMSGSPWEQKGPQKEIRAVFSLYPEAVTLIAPVRTQITEVRDLKGLKVNLGIHQSGPLQNAKDILAVFGLGEHMVQASYLKMSKAVAFMEEGGIAAFFYTVGHPSKIIELASRKQLKARLIEIDEAALAGLFNKNPYYFTTVIPVSFYPGFANKTDVKTIGVKSVLFTSANMNADLVYAIAKEMFENLEYFKTLHPAYKMLTRQNMLERISVPLHEGALRYYREAGLIKDKSKVGLTTNKSKAGLTTNKSKAGLIKDKNKAGLTTNKSEKKKKTPRSSSEESF